MHSCLIKPTDIIRDGLATALVALSILYPSAEKPAPDEHQTKAASVDVTPHEKRQPAGIAQPEACADCKAAPDSPAAKPEAEGHEAPISGAQSAHLIEPEPAPLPEVILPRPEIQATYLAACKEAARTREVLIVTYTDEQQRGRAVDWLNRTEAARRFVWLLEPGEVNRVQIHDVVSQKSRRVSKPSDLEE